MAETVKQTAFSFDDNEAKAVARCEVGTGDLPGKATFWLVFAVLVSLGIRVIFDLPLPSVNMLGIYGATALLWILFLLYIRHRLHVTEEELKKRSLILVEEDEGFALYEFSTELRYHAGYDEITSVEKGEHIYRISAPMGRICLPVRKIPSEFRVKLDSLEGAKQIPRSWM
ncbi:MAG: hypothetical protein J6U30_02300 [Oscillospiraceae bacterium]|nr:hypothetical protein [Oscillospiraceae bacterium]